MSIYRYRFYPVVLGLFACMLLAGFSTVQTATADGNGRAVPGPIKDSPPPLLEEEGKSRKREPDRKRPSARKPRPKREYHWGRRLNESVEQYKKRRTRILKRCRKDELDMWSIRHVGFLVRTDITRDFTVDLALYTEELHRAYSKAFARMGAPPGRMKDLIEIVCYGSRERYVEEGGHEMSGGHFHPAANADPSYWNRPDNWPAGQFRLVLFTDGVHDFDKWEKKTMKHEAAHMELQLRLGYLALDAPRWWNEGMAACFEWWDFSKDVEENFALIPLRGRYAPYVRRMWGTDAWKDFDQIWTIDGAAWHRDMNTEQGFLNYCQAWSLAAFMFNQGVQGKKFFNQLFNLTIRIGEDRVIHASGTRTRGWEVEFPRTARRELEEAWLEWVKTALPKDARNPGEDLIMLRAGYDPDADSLVRLSEEELAEAILRWRAKNREPAGDAKGKQKSRKARPPASDSSGSEGNAPDP